MASRKGGRGDCSMMFAMLSEEEPPRLPNQSIGTTAASLGTHPQISRGVHVSPLLDSATKITEAGLRGSSAKILPTGTVLMTSRASVGFFGIIEVPSCTNQGFISIVPQDAHARMYLLHNLMHRVEEIRSHAGGATYKEINKGKFKTLPVVLPERMLLREFEEQVSTLHTQVRSLHKSNQKLAEARDLLLAAPDERGDSGLMDAQGTIRRGTARWR